MVVTLGQQYHVGAFFCGTVHLVMAITKLRSDAIGPGYWQLRRQSSLSQASRIMCLFFPPTTGGCSEGLGSFVFFIKYPCMTIKEIVQYANVILLFTQAPIPVCLDGTIIDRSTILVTMYYCGYVGV